MAARSLHGNNHHRKTTEYTLQQGSKETIGCTENSSQWDVPVSAPQWCNYNYYWWSHTKRNSVPTWIQPNTGLQLLSSSLQVHSLMQSAVDTCPHIHTHTHTHTHTRSYYYILRTYIQLMGLSAFTEAVMIGKPWQEASVDSAECMHL